MPAVEYQTTGYDDESEKDTGSKMGEMDWLKIYWGGRTTQIITLEFLPQTYLWTSGQYFKLSFKYLQHI